LAESAQHPEESINKDVTDTMKNLQRADEYRRYRAVELMERGEPKDLISRILGVSLVTLNKWQERSRRGEDLNTKISSGRPRTISDEQLTELSRLLFEGAVAHGWENRREGGFA